MALLEIENLNFTYKNAAKEALSGVSFSVARGESVLLCGPTGCGKSTLLSLILKGENAAIKYDGRKIGYVSQSLNVSATDRVMSELAFPCENEGTAPALTRRRVCELAAILGIEKLLDRKICSLSGGERRLVALGAAMIRSPDLLLLDEPASQLDPITAAKFYDCLFRLISEHGTAAIISEHRTEELIGQVDSALVLKEGKVIKKCAPRELSPIAEDRELSGFLTVSARAAYAFGERGTLPLTVSEGRRYIENQLDGKDCKSLKKTEEKCENEMVLSMKNVHFSYDKAEREILDGFELELRQGEALCVLGGNGSGKSTALSVAAGLRRPFLGKVSVFGKNIKSYKGNSLWHENISLLPQNVRALFSKESVREELSGIENVLPFDFSPLYERHPYDLSGGEAHLLGLALALASKPKILLLDEPTQGVDPGGKKMIGEMLAHLKKEGLSIIAVTHDADFAPLFADRCMLISQGRAAGEGSVREFFLGGEYYTTTARRLSRGFFDGVITLDELLEVMT